MLDKVKLGMSRFAGTIGIMLGIFGIFDFFVFIVMGIIGFAVNIGFVLWLLVPGALMFGIPVLVNGIALAKSPKTEYGVKKYRTKVFVNMIILLCIQMCITVLACFFMFALGFEALQIDENSIFTYSDYKAMHMAFGTYSVLYFAMLYLQFVTLVTVIVTMTHKTYKKGTEPEPELPEPVAVPGQITVIPAANPIGTADDINARIDKLQSMKDRGIISDAQYEEGMSKLVAKLTE